MGTTTFVSPACIVSGPGSLAELSRYVREHGRKVLLVTGRKFCRRTGLTDRVAGELHESGCEVTCFEQVPPEPDLTTCDTGRKTLADASCEVVVAVGGGSALDVGKVVAGLA